MRLRYLRLGQIFSFLLAAAVCTKAHAQTDIALSVYGAFSNSATPGNSNFFRVSPAASAGGLFEFRHLSNPLLGWEAAYSFHRANEVYDELILGVPVLGPLPSSCGNTVCPTPTYAVSANAQQFTAGWVPSGHVANLRPFALVGVGLLLNRPISGQSGTTNTSQAAFVYGAGLDWGLVPHISLRLQYRGNLYKAPGIVPPNSTSPNIGLIHTAEPGIGVSYRF
jgi:opacity protein-like surface antigen